MKPIFFLLFIFLAVNAQANDYAQYSNNQIVEAIKRTENSVKYPYGVRSIKCSGDECRRICLNSVRHGRARWIKADKPYDLIVFIGLRYSPPKNNPNWVRLVKYFLK